MVEMLKIQFIISYLIIKYNLLDLILFNNKIQFIRSHLIIKYNLLDLI